MRWLSLALGLAAWSSALTAQGDTAQGVGASLRALDKLTAEVADVVLANRETVRVGRIEITVDQCRYPAGDPSGDAYAFLTVRELGVAEPVFRGWMIASSPALHAMDHPRYDVWVLRCTTS